MPILATSKATFLAPLCALFLLTLVVTTGCASDKKKKADKPPETETALYRSARRSLGANNFVGAIERFQALETLYPFGRYAEQAQLEIVFAHYRAYNLTEARTAADRFIQLNPQHANADYAQYLKALAAFSEGRKPFELGATAGLMSRDLSPLEDAYADFQVLLSLYPHSEYAQDARQRMIFIRNVLAAKEILIGKYYLDQKAFIAAANRGQYVVEHFSQTPAIQDALALMSDAYLFLGMRDLAKTSVELLRANYPDHPNFGPDNEYIAMPSKKSLSRPLLNVLSFGLLAKPKPPRPVILKPDEPQAKVRQADGQTTDDNSTHEG